MLLSLLLLRVSVKLFDFAISYMYDWIWLDLFRLFKSIELESYVYVLSNKLLKYIQIHILKHGFSKFWYKE